MTKTENKTIRVEVWVPVHRTIEAMNTLSLMAMQKHELTRGIVDVDFKFLVGESLIERARNTCAHKFLQGNADYLLFIDSDLLFEPNLLERLLKHEKEIVGGNYCHKTSIIKWAGKPENRNEEVSKASFVPTGAMLIKRSVFKRLDEQPDLPVYDTSEGDNIKGYFNTYVKDKTLLSEDWAFSDRCNRAKVQCYIDNFIRIGHIGNKVYVGG